MSSSSTVLRLIENLGLAAHPEGGFYRETYRSEREVEISVSSNGLEERRSLTTAIYYLLNKMDVSALHRLRSDELWHFYLGCSVTLHIFDPTSDYTPSRLGNRFEKGESPQHAVKAGCWFGATLDDTSSFALVGCTVAPGFEFSDFELADRATLVAAYPKQADIITRLTRESIT